MSFAGKIIEKFLSDLGCFQRIFPCLACIIHHMQNRSSIKTFIPQKTGLALPNPLIMMSQALRITPVQQIATRLHPVKTRLGFLKCNLQSRLIHPFLPGLQGSKPGRLSPLQP